MRSSFDCDVLVIGGGPAGLVAAIAARRQGFEVTLADTAQPPIDKACGEGILPAGVQHLLGIGVDLKRAPHAELAGIRFIDSEGECEARFTGAKGVGISRIALHRTLVERAEQCGVDLHWGTQPNVGEQFKARYVIVADGGRSRTRRLFGFADGKVRRERIGFRTHYRVRPWSQFVEVYWSRRGQMYVTPVADDELGVAFLSNDPHLRFESALPLFPELSERLRDVPQSDRTRGAIITSGKLPRVQHATTALVGDASGSVDAITGVGLSLAFAQGLRVAECIRRGDLKPYESAYRDIMHLPNLMSRMLLFMGDNEALRARTVRAFSREPELFAHLLGMHTGALRGSRTAFTALRLGWGLLTA
ncbi:MAG TPA: NAD(P)/FAD-dependent oxidoreductase [candidate division Zixibacteria bacterium]|nr:NAD(P)/FAD-dependent oxidoreductase [candidate division Zixibacteria bacterium]